MKLFLGIIIGIVVGLGLSTLFSSVVAQDIREILVVPKECVDVVRQIQQSLPTKEIIKEVPRIVERVITVEVVSPVSYAAIGIATVLTVVSGVLFTRRKRES